MSTSGTEPEFADGWDFIDPDLCARRLPLAEFAWLRETTPVWWSTQRPNTVGFGDDGYRVVGKHADVVVSGAVASTSASAPTRHGRKSS